MDKANRRFLTWMGVLFWALLCVALDLYTTGVGLSLGAHELNRFGNQPFLEYPVAFVSTSMMYLVHLNAAQHRNTFLNKCIMLLTVGVVSLPLVAAVNNMMVISWLS